MQEKNVKTLTFSERLLSLMETGGFKQREIADNAGVSRTSLIHWKTGRSVPSSTELYKLSKFFGCSMEWLLTGEDEEGKPNASIAIYKERANIAEKRISDLKEAMIGVIQKF